MIPLFEVNDLSLERFLTLFGDVAEHSPWVAREAAAYRPFATRDAMIDAFSRALRAANSTAQLAVIRAHPDLATKARLSDDSGREQAGAGLNALSAQEFDRFTRLNAQYRDRFGFPFIFAVKGATRQMIMAAFEERVSNAPEAELETALNQIGRIFRFRIEDRVEL
ncbi:MAG: 2-oxo-4-hydroxy-4-carboxy-5-ureidoimidazoline decarboxylase [Alphaproteobacteria bacterium]|nr:2-oxo-4-hydroxy-4-carboxy-5-ureidoimidazoline decarboxylase [Alphaproteobacteria bacterium]